MIKDIQGDRKYSAIGIYWSRLSWAGSFTWALKNSTNTASNYTAINKPVAHVQMRKPRRVHMGDTAIARRLDNCSSEPDFKGLRGWNRDVVSIMGTMKQLWLCTALPILTCYIQTQRNKCPNSAKKACFQPPFSPPWRWPAMLGTH